MQYLEAGTPTSPLATGNGPAIGGVVAAGLIADDYMGKENPDARIFRFGR